MATHALLLCLRSSNRFSPEGYPMAASTLLTLPCYDKMPGVCARMTSRCEGGGLSGTQFSECAPGPHA